MLKLIKEIVGKKNDQRQLGDNNLFGIARIAELKLHAIKINVGCGTDYRDGFINIDGSTTLQKVDKVIDISTDSLLNHFDAESIDYILANDIIEHHYHWEAVRLLIDFYRLLKQGGVCEVRVPDCDYIISSDSWSPDRKLTLLFGGQDVPQGIDAEMDASRKKFPQYFCHKYGWSMKRMQTDLNAIGFRSLAMKGVGSNFVTIAQK